MINEQKILDHLQNDLKLSLVDVDSNHWIKVKSRVQRIKALIEFVEPLHYTVQFFSPHLCIIPNS